MKTISTKFLPATNYRGSRIKAADGDNSITLSYDHAANAEANHAAAALALCRKLNWEGAMQGGSTKDGMVFCFLDKASQFTAHNE